MKNIFLNITVIIIASCGFYARSIMAQDYPVFYDTENPTYGNVAVPNIPFTENPAACAEDDEECINTYLDPFAAHLEGNMNAQRLPSPVYTWEEGKCVLGSGEAAAEQCGKYEDQWQAWNERAVTASLDFVQGPAQSDLTCNDVYDWWGMRYVYKCQDVK